MHLKSFPGLIQFVLSAGLIVYRLSWIDSLTTGNFGVPLRFTIASHAFDNRLCGEYFLELGLIDIVMPGIIISASFHPVLCSQFGKVLYWRLSLLGFGVGFLAASINLVSVNRASLLLYSVPLCIVTPLVAAALRGELRHSLRFHP